MAKSSPLPGHRLSRLLHLGRLAGGIAGGALGEGARQLASGQRPKASELLLTPANAMRLAERLSEMRGAAMKVGQLLSMEAGDFLPPELTAVLARLREDAHSMPFSQLAAVLTATWGPGWEKRFKRFTFEPMAAASIGQVHRAMSADGRDLAIKVQYPKVRQSIDSDVDNVAGLLRLFRLLPEGLDLGELFAEAKQQLHAEADYLVEAGHMDAYRERLAELPGFELPNVDLGLTTSDVLAMDYLEGEPIEALAQGPAATRDRVAERLLGLALHELFAWGLVQTDPNFANYRYRAADDRIGLLDFGATRSYGPERVDALRTLLQGTLASDRAAVAAAAVDAGYLGADDDPSYREAVVGLIRQAAEPALHTGAYDFGNTDLANRMSEQVLKLRVEQRFWRLPPPDILFLHRKLGGMYLLCSRLRARVNVAALVEPYLA